MKFIAVSLMASLVVAPLALAQEGTSESLEATGAAFIGAAPAIIIAASKPASAAFGVALIGSSPMTLLTGTAIALGVWREWKTDPTRRGLYRYMGQEEAAGSEYRKWERDPDSRWMRLKGYEQVA